jgi:hypothetical protein
MCPVLMSWQAIPIRAAPGFVILGASGAVTSLSPRLAACSLPREELGAG